MNKDFSCGACRKKLSDYQLGFTDEREASVIKAHLENCAECRAELEKLEKIENILRSTEEIPLPSDFKSSLHRRLVEAQAAKENKKTGFFGRLIPRSRVFVPVLTAFILVAVFSTGIYELMLNQIEETEIYNNPVQETSDEQILPSDIAEDTEISEDEDNTSDTTNNNAKTDTRVSNPAPEKKADKTQNSAGTEPEKSIIAGDTEAQNYLDAAEERKGKGAGGGAAVTESADESISDFADEDDMGKAMPRMYSASVGVDSSEIDDIASTGGAVYIVKIEVRNAKALIKNLDFTDRAVFADGEYSITMSYEEFRGLIRDLPKSANIVSGEREVYSEADNYLVIITEK